MEEEKMYVLDGHVCTDTPPATNGLLNIQAQHKTPLVGLCEGWDEVEGSYAQRIWHSIYAHPPS